ncbi:MAG TPA: alpha/beta hydrolase [Vicinamibacterales bacterium]|nr:alpha/beta hydrolase [Vicinamibacterales bacterium]
MKHHVIATLCTALLLIASPLHAATLDGMKIHSTATGKGSKTLVLVHGWTCDETSWAMNVPELAKRYRVITLDLPGHGKSDAPKDGKVTMEMFAKAVEAVRAEQQAEKIILVGHSMGTPVIREYAHLYPQHVAALVLVDGVVVAPTPPGGRGIQTPLDPDKLTTPEGLAMREGMITGMFTPKTPKAVQQHVLKMMLAAPPATAASAMRTTFDEKYASDEVMNVPAYGIFAEKSFALPQTPFLKKVFPTFDYVAMPGTGHFVMMEQPKEFNRLLITFVESL